MNLLFLAVLWFCGASTSSAMIPLEDRPERIMRREGIALSRNSAALLDVVNQSGDVDVCKTSSSYTMKLVGNGWSDLFINGTSRADFTNTAAMPQTVDVTFRVQAVDNSGTQTGSGSVLRQVALKMLDRDPCNLLYVIYRIDPWYQQASKKGKRDQLKVQIKKNAGKHTSAECGNGGYTTVGDENIWTTIEGVGMVHSMVRLQAALSGGSLQVTVARNGTQSTSHTFDVSSADWQPSGGLGLRTDNVDTAMNFAEPRISGQVRLFTDNECQA